MSDNQEEFPPRKRIKWDFTNISCATLSKQRTYQHLICKEIYSTLQWISKCIRNGLQLTSHIAKFMWQTWGPTESCRPQVGPTLDPWTLLSGICFRVYTLIRSDCNLAKRMDQSANENRSDVWSPVSILMTYNDQHLTHGTCGYTLIYVGCFVIIYLF